MPATTPNALYAAPSVTVQAQGAQSLITTGSAATVVMVVGTAPSGPDYPVLVDAARAQQLFGFANGSNTVGYTLPLGISIINGQRQSTTNNQLLYLVCRCGVTRASGAALDQTATPLTAFTISGIGAYAGSAGTNLTMVVSVTGSTVTSIAINDVSSGSPVQKQLFTNTSFDLSSNARIAAAINGANPLTSASSIVQVTNVNLSALALKAQTLALTGGADGKGLTVATDSSATITAALLNSLWTHADLVWMGFDAFTTQSILNAHLNQAQASYNEFREAYVGPGYGTTYATLTTTYQTFNSSRVVCIGHDGAYGVYPPSGLVTILDGFYLAAAACGLKAVGPVAETTTGMTIAGFSTLSQPTDLTSPLSQTNLNALAGSGYLVFEQRQNGALVVRDAITTAPYIVNSTINPFSQVNIQTIDDAVSNACVRAVSPFKGRPSASLTQQISQLQNAVTTALAGLGTTINGINSVVVSVDPNTLIPTVNVSYITRYPYQSISIVTSYSFL